MSLLKKKGFFYLPYFHWFLSLWGSRQGLGGRERRADKVFYAAIGHLNEDLNTACLLLGQINKRKSIHSCVLIDTWAMDYYCILSYN